MIEFNNKKKFEKKLLELINSPNKLKEMSKNAKFFAKHFHIDVIIKKWVKLFEDIDKEQ